MPYCSGHFESILQHIIILLQPVFTGNNSKYQFYHA